jgi:hypothetical protein
MNQLRQNVRNFLIAATLEELEKEYTNAKNSNEHEKAYYIAELIVLDGNEKIQDCHIALRKLT